jgi:rSAM/selenodomain-associated transferase 2
MPTLSIIVPALDEAAGIAAALTALAPMRRRDCEVIVVDGGSRDGTPDLARPLADRVITAPRGRAAQMNAGAAIAQADVLLFLHADTRLPADAGCRVRDGLARSGRVWGRFDVRIEGRHRLLAVIAGAMNLRSRLSGIATGDQAMFMTRAAFAAAGGFPEIALMEDVAFSARLKALGRPLCLRERVVTSGRRWESRGVIATIALMWHLRLAYYFGAKPAALAKQYGYVPRER